MAYELQEQILLATEGGLQIIIRYYPQAADTINSNNKKFSIRDERTPSCSLKQLKDGNWVVTDFGGDQIPRNGIQVCMFEENISYREAIAKLSGEHSIGGIKRDINKPGFEIIDATPDQKEGEYFFELNEKLSENELKLLGPLVTQEVCDTYHFYSLKSFTYIKGRKAQITTATENYPIFLIDHGEWKKIYQPLSFDKQYRFRYVGSKPKDLINGLDILIKKNVKFEQDQLKELEIKEAQGEKTDGKIKKYPEAILCSGERDALNIAGHGYVPLWLNSETAGLDDKQYRTIMRNCETLYDLPDIDKTGLKAAIRLCLQHLEIKLIMLPESLKKFRDNRGKMKKDFRDYVEIYPKRKDFQKLIDVAMPMQFWSVTYSEKTGLKYNYKPSQAFQFLQSNGFWKIENKNTKEGEEFIQIDGNVVTPVKGNDIKGFMFKFCEDRFLPIDLRDMLHSTTKLSDSSLSGLKLIDIDFTDFDKNSQYIFFRNKTLRVTGNEIKAYNAGEVSKYVWSEEVIDHNFSLEKEPPFVIKADKKGGYDIDVKNTNSKFFSFLINASRVFWRDELEVRMNGMSEKEQEDYRKKHKFDIAGPHLKEEEIELQKQHLINKIFSIGYLLHRYKDESKPWAVWATDNRISEDETESNGRSGKSFCFKTVRLFMKAVTLPGRNPKLTDNPHIYDRVTEHTDMIIVDDADQYLGFKFFFDSITGELIVNPKNNQSYEIPFEHSPKFVFTSNFVLKNIDLSTEARLLYTVFSDYYHEKGEGDYYKETRKVSDDFGKNLFKADYSESEWNADFNFFVNCLQFYLSVPGNRKLNAPMGNVNQRQLLTQMGQQFKEWADVYLTTDEFVVRSVAMKEFETKSQLKGWTTNKFTRATRAWCQLNGYELNPKVFQNSQGRIVRKNDGKAEDMIYIQTKPIDPDQLSDENIPDDSPGEKLPF